MHCDLIMAVWNEPNITLTAIKSIHAHSNFKYRLIIIDNASDLATTSMLRRLAISREYGEIEIIRNEQNRGWLKATNQGLAKASGKYVCLINNDVVAGPDWLKNCITTLERLPDAGLANPRGNERSENRRVGNVSAYAHKLAENRRGQYTELDHGCGFCMVIKRELLQKLPALDESYDGGHFEDDDYSRQAQRLGYRCIQCDDAFVLHLGSVSFRKIPEERQRLIAQNRVLYEKRWGKRSRVLVLCRTPDNGDILRRARTGDILYVVSNRYFNEKLLTTPHSNIKFLKSPLTLVSDRLFFSLQRAYLRYKKRIDETWIQNEE